MPAIRNAAAKNASADLGFGAKLWLAADKHRLSDLIELIATISPTTASEGKSGGHFYRPSCVVRCLVNMVAPYKGRIYFPCYGSGGMFVQSVKFVESHISTGQSDSGPPSNETIQRPLRSDLSKPAARLAVESPVGAGQPQ